jgi:dTDP-4-dehydrorhamnose 3,5-epimerase
MTIAAEQRVSHLKAGSPIAGVQLRKLKMNHDDRGCFTEVFRDSWGLGIDPVQWSVVKSEPGVLRGLHFHRRHDEYFSILQGKALVGFKDARIESPTFNAWSLYELCGEDLACLAFPRGVVHGLYYPEPTLHIQCVSEDYSHYGEDDNLGCHWSDPELGIPWPDAEPIVAARAQSFGTYFQLLDQVYGSQRKAA